MSDTRQTIVYVTRDIERALGMEPGPRYRVVANRTRYGETVQKKYPDYVTLIDIPAEHTPGHLPSTADLISHPSVAKLMKDLEGANPVLLVFKNSARIEAAATAHGSKIINPPTSLAEKVENKISQVGWLGELGAKYLPPHSIQSTRSIKWNGDPFILQWAHSHTGGGTILVTNAADLAKQQEKFPDRLARITSFVSGPSFTVNAVVAGTEILIGNVSYQITGLPPLTENDFSTIGNDWSVTHSLLSGSEIETLHEITRAVGTKLSESGWRGLFGVDFIRDDERDRLHLLEVNARQPASTPFESILQSANRNHGMKGTTIFEAHIDALRGDGIPGTLVEINDGAQVLQRITKTAKQVPHTTVEKLNQAGYTTISYENAENNADLLRIQSAKGIMVDHKKWNSRGKEILATLEGMK